MLGRARGIVREAEGLHHLHLLLDEAHHLLRGTLGGDGAEGELVDAREFRREHRQALDVDAAAGEDVGNRAQQTHLVLGVHRDDIHATAVPGRV